MSAIKITVKFSTGAYVARIKGFKRTASSTISARAAAVALAWKYFGETTDTLWFLSCGSISGDSEMFALTTEANAQEASTCPLR